MRQLFRADYLLANRAATDKHFQRISIAARILSLKLDAVDGETDQALDIRRSEEAHQEAKVNMKNFCASEEGIDAICLESADFLLRLHNRSEIESVAREILLQGTLSTWAALEMLIGDSLVFLLNFEPRIATKLLSDPNARKKFEPPKISAEYLAERGFNLSNQMGTLLFSERDLSNLPTIRIACEAIFESYALRTLLTSDSLWLLNQQRHLIAHRRGIVDEDYIKNTGAKLSVGEHLYVSPEEFEENASKALSIGKELLKCAASILREN